MSRALARTAINPAQRRLKTFLITSVVLLAMSFAINHANSAGGYGGFEAYVIGVASDDNLTMRAGHSARTAAVGSIRSDGEGVYVHWCDTFGRSDWCDVSHQGKRGWVKASFLQNIEGGM